jgi:hypothetical protein
VLGLAERPADVVDTVGAGENDVGDAVLAEQRELVREEGPAEQRDDGLRAPQGQRPQPRALATGQDDRLSGRRYLAGAQGSASLISITGMPSRMG